jgi:hypothetical protein
LIRRTGGNLPQWGSLFGIGFHRNTSHYLMYSTSNLIPNHRTGNGTNRTTTERKLFSKLNLQGRHIFFRESTKPAETPTEGVELHTYVASVPAENKNDPSGRGGGGGGDSPSHCSFPRHS